MTEAEISPLWTPSPERRAGSRMQRFIEFAQRSASLTGDDYWALHRWSTEHYEEFWDRAQEFLAIQWDVAPRTSFVPAPERRMLGGQWFPGGELNFAKNLMPPPSDEVVIVGIAEGRSEPRSITAGELWREVAIWQRVLSHAGVKKGDRVAGVLANCPEAIIAMLATASLGAIWSSCSPDFGTRGIVDRLGQIAPTVVFFTTGYQYGGKYHSTRTTIEECLAELPSTRLAVLVDLLDRSENVTAKVPLARWQEAREQTRGKLPDADLTVKFTPTPFDHPIYIMFSSGTTGVPKCIVHGAGGTLLQHKKELALHSDLGPGDRLMFYTTCGWMMWNWMASALSVGAGIVVYDGSVASPDLGVLWRIAAEHRVTALGTSPKFIGVSRQSDVRPKREGDLSGLRTILSTGSPLLPEHFEWVYRELGSGVHLASISGGTDIISCFMLGSPTLPVYAGEIQCPGLGMAVEAWRDEGEPVVGEKGELVCTKPFPSMPLGFWRDEDQKKYREAYFDFYPSREVWRHGDYIEITPHGGIIVYGRSDATLNPGGVRIGTAEIYRQVETLPGIVDSLAIGRRAAGDTEIVLFIKLAPNVAMTDELAQTVKSRIRSQLTARHVPREVRAVRDIPYTRSGKKVELAVTKAIHGEPVDNLSALANPESLDEYFALSKEWSVS